MLANNAYKRYSLTMFTKNAHQQCSPSILTTYNSPTILTKDEQCSLPIFTNNRSVGAGPVCTAQASLIRSNLKPDFIQLNAHWQQCSPTMLTMLTMFAMIISGHCPPSIQSPADNRCSINLSCSMTMTSS